MKIIILIGFLLTFLQGFSQLKGLVYGNTENDKSKIYGAKVKSLRTKNGVITCESGIFELTLKEFPDTIVISAIGYHNDTLIVTKKDRFATYEINLFSEQLLPEMIVSARQKTHGIIKLNPLQVENISEGELRKAACCNLSESFETNVSVDVNMTDAVSGAKRIQMMGLDGVYTQIQMENIPYLRGLESASGLASIPGTWVESIQITKGTGNIVNGYESMAGLVNIELKKPETMEKFFLNGYGNIFGRAELNVHGSEKVSKKIHSGYFAHASGMFGELDQNKDNFRDIPKSKNASFLNRWTYSGRKMKAQWGLNSYYEDKQGGQMGFNSRVASNLYGVHLENKHVDVFAKTAFFFQNKPYQSVGVVYNLKYQESNALFGLKTFSGLERRAYVNAIYDGIIGNTDHGIKLGTSLVYADIHQQLDSLDFSLFTLPRVEIVPGVFSEYTLRTTRFTSVLGLRSDYHNLYGIQTSPRIHGKFSINESLDIRFTGGRGFRVPNAIIDNISLLATSRAWVIDTEVLPEISWNVGGSFVYEFSFSNRKASISSDFYHTYFENQLVVDRDFSTNHIYFKNVEGASFSNSFQTELSLPLLKNFDVRLAYKYLDVQSNLGGIMQQQVMIPKHRGFLNLAYFSRNKRWEYDLTINLIGKSRLHMAHLPDNSYTNNNESQAYPMINANITHVYKKWDFYIGGENLANYTQKNPIVDVENPFGSHFDATRVWAPIQGMNIYVGLRYKIKKSTK
jgi:outer membrane receptor for ferrienterochelin and colicins